MSAVSVATLRAQLMRSREMGSAANWRGVGKLGYRIACHAIAWACVQLIDLDEPAGDEFGDSGLMVGGIWLMCPHCGGRDPEVEVHGHSQCRHCGGVIRRCCDD